MSRIWQAILKWWSHDGFPATFRHMDAAPKQAAPAQLTGPAAQCFTMDVNDLPVHSLATLKPGIYSASFDFEAAEV
jgi:hypothetical protein